MSELIKVDEDYKEWLETISQRYKQCQIKAAVAVNRELIRFYWLFGKEIIEKQAESRWGHRFYDTLSEDLRREFSGVKGFSSRNLRYMS